MDGVSALVAGLLTALHRSVAPDFCPGGWPWAVSMLGVVVGLLPGVGAMLIALLRKTSGNSRTLISAAIGFVSAGLLPLILFATTGRIFAAVAGGTVVPGLGRTGLRAAACYGVVGSQADYLGRGTVAAAFAGTSPVRLGVGLVGLGLVPVVVATFTYVQARIALRRGPRWPAVFFWLPTLAVAVFTMGAPALAAVHLWLGAGFGALLGMLLPLLVGPPSWATIGRPGGRQRAQPPAPARPAKQAAARAAQPSRVPAARSAPDSGARSAQAPSRGHRPTLVAPAVAHAPAAGRAPAVSQSVPGRPRFQLIRRLGSGGFGRVWLAQDAKLGHVVALKAAHAPDAETERRIQREAQALAAVRHPNCVRIYDMVPARSDTGLADLDGMVIVMGYVEGQSLGDQVRDHGLLDDVAAARVWINLAGALGAAHSRGVLHRDVKPGNVVVDPSGVAHLIDFGIARKTGDATMTQAGFVLGTPDFLAPEIACGERASPASDAWQLAATISYALTGHPPRGGHADAVSGLRAAATGAALTHLPRRTAHLALLRAAMDNDPARRPLLRDVQRALDEWLRRTGGAATGQPAAAARLR
ncbi:MAG TPA: serine/threonine-protein kinase [Pseudonocardia sp.]